MKEVKKDTQAYKYQITINNPLDAEITVGDKKVNVPFTHEEILSRLSTLTTIEYGCMVDEIGTEGNTPHTHIFICSPNSAIRFSSIKRRFPTAHIENAYGTCQDNKEYFQKAGKWANTSKSETTQPGTFEEWGTMPSEEGTSTRAEHKIILALLENGYQDAEILRMYPESILYLDKVQRARQTLLEDRAKSNWRDLEVTYIYGKTNTGKTRSVMEQYGYENVYRITDYAHPWDSYKMQDVVLFEEFRSSLRIQDMLSYLDGYPCTLPARYANKQAGFTKVFITTNIPLEKQYPEVQEKEPETWAAFKRRIHRVQMFYGDDVVDTFESVGEYLTFRSRKAAKKPSHSKLPSLALPSTDSSITDNDFQSLMPSDKGSEKDD